MFRWLALVLCWCGLAGESAAVTAQVANPDLRLRKHAPIPLQLDLQHDGIGILQGRVEAVILHGDRKVGVHRSVELTLTPGRRRVPFLLPPPPGADNADAVAVQLRFASATGVTSLVDHRIGTYNLGGHDFVLAVGATDRRWNEVDNERMRSVRLEALRPLLEARAFFTTQVAMTPVEDLPVEPIGWCAFDVVLLDSSAFAAVSNRQLTSLAQWVDAGGSVMVFADLPIGPRQLEWLQRMAKDTGTVLPMDATGRLTEPGVLRLSSGLGRAVIAPAPPSKMTELRDPVWRREIAWLWKMNSAAQDQVARDGAWKARTLEDPPEFRMQDFWESQFQDWLRVRGMGVDSLSPDRPRPLPLGLVSLVLGGLLLLAGPADWFVLGWLRRRRATWILFPALCIGCAWLAADFAGRYLGRSGRNGFVQITDVGIGGRVLREIRYDMQMPASDAEWVDQVSDGISGPSVAEESDAFVPGMPVETPVDTAPPPAQTEWVSGGQFRIRQKLRQWAPAWRESLRFRSETAQPDWEELIRAWRGRTDHWALPARHGEFHVRFVDATSGMPIAVPADRGRMVEDFENGFFRPAGPLPQLLESHSPVISGIPLARSKVIGEVGILAWREFPNGTVVFRRHVGSSEGKRAP